MNLIDIVKNAPEGATHYSPETNERYLAYYKDNGCSHFIPRKQESKWASPGKPLSSYKDALPLPKLEASYVKVEDVIWDLRPDFEAGELYYYQGGEYHKITKEPELLCYYKHRSIYRRIDKIIDEREEFVKRAVNNHFSQSGLIEVVLREMFDAGCRFID